ncbi:MAG TPA: 3-methyl-2-oxobutanoate hydroxymethyltransferase [Candidatus Dormibacteraeota bacterium]|nr:3-methyl-2-oxobutanoate hydroxymethyltransferase [Candidatus Dormibacteraeota bacterium]
MPGIGVDPQPKVTVPRLLEMNAAGERIAMVTAYDHPSARLADQAGVDVVLVGDTLAEVIQGHATTLPVTLDEMIYHARLVRRGCCRALLVGDLPFGSYQISAQAALESAVRLIKEGGVEAVKLEGGINVAATIAAIAAIDIPVIGHIGLTPQSIHRMGGYRLQGRRSGRSPGQRERLLEDARAVEEAGAFAVVLEAIPRDLAAEITAQLRIPTIGIGAGASCAGQVLVMHDVLGLSERRPRFARAYADLRTQALAAMEAFVRDVRAGAFPTARHSYGAGPGNGADPPVGEMPVSS